MLVDYSHKRAAKAAVALLVVHSEADPRLVGPAVGEAAANQGLQLGNLGSASELMRYACGVQANGEGVSNRKWGRYPTDVRRTAYALAQEAKALIEEDLGF